MFGILPLHNLHLLKEWCTAQCVFVHKLLQARMCIILRNLHEKCRSKSGELVMKDLEVAAKNFLRRSFLFPSCISKYISTSGPGGCWLPRGICALTCTCKYWYTFFLVEFPLRGCSTLLEARPERPWLFRWRCTGCHIIDV